MPGRPVEPRTTSSGFEAASTTPQNLVLAASAMAAVPTLVFFLVFPRNILSGLTAGSLKG